MTPKIRFVPVVEPDISAIYPSAGSGRLSQPGHTPDPGFDVPNMSLRKSEKVHWQMITILDSIQTLIYVLDPDTYEILFVNKYGRDSYGAVTGQRCWQVFQKGQEGPCSFCYKERMKPESSNGEPFYWELKSTYNQRYYEYSITLIKWVDGRGVNLAIATDITERKLAEELITQSREWYRTMAEDITSFICRFNPDYKLTFVNDAYCRFFGVERSKILGDSFLRVTPEEEQQKVISAIYQLTPENPIITIENANIGHDGSVKWVKWINRAIYDQNGCLREYLSAGEDITERREYETKLRYLTLYDSLTGTFNRSYYESEIRRLEGGREYPVAIIAGDLDRLKSINDNYGHNVGDRVLESCAEILKKSIRKGDVLARVGGDEFVIIMPRTDRESAKAVLDRIRSEVEKHNCRPDNLAVSISLGLAVSSGPGQKLDQVFDQADLRMYREKAGKA